MRVAFGATVCALLFAGCSAENNSLGDARHGADARSDTIDVAIADLGARPDAPITCPMPPPAYVREDGGCVPSCLAAGGTTCDPALCAGRQIFAAYDCTTCCAVPPANCGGIPSTWVCGADGRSRQRCTDGALQMESCSLSCVPASGPGDATCSSMMSTCTGSASGNSPAWTCTSDRRSRQRCVMSAVQTDACANGCVESAVGADDTCASAPSTCTGSASGTSAIWTCTTDAHSRQRCVTGAVQTEACANGCVSQPLGTDDYCAMAGMSCSGSASGTSSIWTCTADNTARQRCVSSSVQTEACPYGCGAMPTGTDDTCLPMPMPGSGTVSCAYPQWWNLPYSWDPGFYTVRYGLDNDLRMAAGTGVQLRHNSRLLSEGVFGWGWMPEFQDMVTGQHFRFLHLQPTRRLTRAIGTTYPAGTLVGYSGGNTADTGYPTYSTGAHLCVQTTGSYRSAFPMGTDPCR